MAEGGDGWELSKENVQPLKHGRAMATLQEVLAQHESSSHTLIQPQKQAFESEIRFYSGDDPLDVWDRYVKWAEQAFPQGGKESNLSALLERAVKTFYEDTKYFQDLRYLKLWLKFANVCSEPLDLYSYLHGQGIGTSHARFYIAWAEEYEARGNFKKADSIFQEGFQRKAEPLENLKSRHKEFQARLSRQVLQNIIEGNAETEDADYLDAPELQRASLVDLKCRGKKKVKAPISRVGDFVKPARQVFGVQSTALQQVRATPQFQVFQENDSVNSGLHLQELTPQPWAAPPPARAKENQQGPKPWNSGRPHRNGSSGSEAPCTLPSFTPFVEESAQQQFMTPCKINPSITSVLSARKPTQDDDPLQRVQSCSKNKGEEAMYCKSKVYGGLDEYSFEEIRAEIHMKKMEKEWEERMHTSISRRDEATKKLEEMEKRLLEAAQTNPQIVDQCTAISKPETETMLSSNVCNSPGTDDPAAAICESLEKSVFFSEEPPIQATLKDILPVKQEDLEQHGSVDAIAPALGVCSSLPFTIFDESISSNTSLPPPCVGRPLSAFQNPSNPTTDADVKLEGQCGRNNTFYSSFQNELDGIEPFSGSDENKMMFPIPDDTCDFASAAHLSSTPFHRLVTETGQSSTDKSRLQNRTCTPPERKPLCEKVLDYAPSSEKQVSCMEKLSPILEASREDTPLSISSTSLSVGISTVKSLCMDLANLSGNDHEQTSGDSSKAVWCAKLCKQLLESPSEVTGILEFHQEPKSMSQMEEQKDVTLGREIYKLEREVKLGENDTLFLGVQYESLEGISMKRVALKVCSRPVPWEFYIVLKLKERLGEEFNQDFMDCSCFLYTDGCVILYQDINGQSLKDFIQDLTSRNEDLKSTVEDLMLLIAHGLISLVEKLHSAEIIHGDLRPEIILLGDKIFDLFSDEGGSVLHLVDFSHSWDLRICPQAISVSGFPTAQSDIGQQILSQCSSPYQVDMIGIAEIIHFTIFGNPLKAHQEDLQWKLSQAIQSDWNNDIWTKIFTKTLNANGTSTLLVLRELKDEINQMFDCDFQLRLFDLQNIF
ncbi:mitotic checkpoint serine/threonine-protein kinase BUB1 beta [Ambystoma mexicanum]|uniref:mitotic checkpoint serine/threonine-protein kinase BUB1 beta n=1 Tax=Ambystoma mexicanum TaxID=8296 RepID=UPI0037E8B947